MQQHLISYCLLCRHRTCWRNHFTSGSWCLQITSQKSTSLRSTSPRSRRLTWACWRERRPCFTSLQTALSTPTRTSRGSCESEKRYSHVFINLPCVITSLSWRIFYLNCVYFCNSLKIRAFLRSCWQVFTPREKITDPLLTSLVLKLLACFVKKKKT